MKDTRKVRKSPAESATSLPEGTIKSNWVVKKASNGVPRWVPSTSVELNGFRLFTVDYAAKHIGKPIILYSREYQDTWPKRNAWSTSDNPTYTKLKFIPTGDAIKGKTRIEGWLKTQKPAIKRGMRFFLDGPIYECHGKKCEDYFEDGMSVDSSNGKIVTYNLMNTETFVKV